MRTATNTKRATFIKTLLAAAIASTGSPIVQAQLEEIIVVARKTEESLQSVPISVTAIGGQDITELNIRSANEVLDFVPGATYLTSNPGEQVFSIRGISSGSEGASTDSGVLVMVDNEVISRDFMRSAAMFDVQRVEVLRGPQGTTYGRNASGGVMHILNNTPSEENEGSIMATYGNYDTVGLEGFVNGKLGDTTSGRLSLQYTDRDGYTEETTTGDDIDSWTSTALRGQLLFQPSDDLSILLRGHYLEDESGGNPAPKKCFDPALPCDFRFDSAAFSYMESSSDSWKVENSTSDLGYEREIYGASAEIVWNLDALNVTSITTYRDGNDDADVDLFGTPGDLVMQRSENDATTWSQELRIDNFGSETNINWLAGVFYLNEDHERHEIKNILVDIIAVDPVFGPEPGESWETTQDFDQTNETDSYGIFGEMNFTLGENTDLAVGARYSYDEKSYSAYHAAEGPLAGAVFLDDPSQAVVGDVEEDWDALTGRLSLTHSFSDTGMVFASVSSGYKSGGFNPEPANLEALETPFDEETVIAYEIGTKTQFLDDRLRLNASIFYSDYDDIQTEDHTPTGTTIIANAASATIAGVEFETVWLVTDHLTLQASYANYDHEYGDYFDEDGKNLKGNDIQNVPDWTANVSGAYNVPLSSGSAMGFRLDYRTRADVFDDADPDYEQGIREGKDMLGARASWFSANEQWEVAAWGKNLLDEDEVTNIGTKSIMSQRRVVYVPPRTYGLSVTYSWM